MDKDARQCSRCQGTLIAVWQYGDIEMGQCPTCGEVPLATVCYGVPREVLPETDFVATAVNDGTHDYFLRLSKLVPEFNVVQLKRKEIAIGGRRVVPLGVRTNTIRVHQFMERASKLHLMIDLEPLDEREHPRSE